METMEPAPRWAVRAARAAAWTVVPSGLWRVALGVGLPVGFHGELEEMFARWMPGWGTVYVLALSAAAEALAFLTLGLVRPWGRRVPGWVPRLGGRGLPAWAVLAPAGLGALAVTFVTWSAATGPWQHNMSDPDSPHGLAGLLMTLCYLPLLAWGPLLAAVTVDHARRAVNSRLPART
ncbi:hypothetical protein ACFV1L_22805 [Kitasatospora sp. NPDC059646]|uniref:hypothetical protein n=1 Tax=Kitasatospora sp. NPDC059646 TaxID=3346893 RepID=UPI0036CC78BF